jgi:hypothetical protein
MMRIEITKIEATRMRPAIVSVLSCEIPADPSAEFVNDGADCKRFSLRLGQELRVAMIDPRRLQQSLQLEQTRHKTGPLKRDEIQFVLCRQERPPKGQ